MLYGQLYRHTELAGRAQSTTTNYGRCLARMALHFNCSPIELDTEQVLDYLLYCKNQHKTPSESLGPTPRFKHTVYGLRLVYRLNDMDERRISLPSIERPKKLPVVLSQSEVRLLIATPKLLKHRVLLAMLYGCGLRCAELCNICLSDLCFERKQLHIKQGKGRKDRYVPLADLLIRGLQQYIQAEHPTTWLFNAKNAEGEKKPLTPRGVQWIVREAKKHSGIDKQVTTHSLRHTYATHLLEMGLDILSLKEALGHATIQTTMVYLHVAQMEKRNAFSPLEYLYTVSR